MATIKEAKRRSLFQVIALIFAVIVIVVGVVIFQNWSNNRPGRAPQDIALSASVGDSSVEVFPYMSCEPGTQCPEGEVPNIVVGQDDTLVLDIPADITNHEWQILTIYTDPAANDEQLHGAHETSRVEIPGSVEPIEASSGKRPRLQVVEVSAMMLGTDDSGQEIPVMTVWSLSTMSEEELAASSTAKN